MDDHILNSKLAAVFCVYSWLLVQIYMLMIPCTNLLNLVRKRKQQ